MEVTADDSQNFRWRSSLQARWVCRLPLLFVAYGMRVGVPLDHSSSTRDASTKAGQRCLHNDSKFEDPFGDCGHTAVWATGKLGTIPCSQSMLKLAIQP
jgi:hypothetical protein